MGRVWRGDLVARRRLAGMRDCGRWWGETGSRDGMFIYEKGYEIRREEDQEVVCNMSKEIKHEASVERRI